MIAIPTTTTTVSDSSACVVFVIVCDEWQDYATGSMANECGSLRIDCRASEGYNHSPETPRAQQRPASAPEWPYPWRMHTGRARFVAQVVSRTPAGCMWQKQRGFKIGRDI